MFGGFAACGIRNRMLAAIFQTVEAGDAAAVIYRMVLGIDARSLATACAQAAIDAFFGVDNGSEQRIARQESEYRSDRTDGVAPCATVAPCQHRDNSKRRESHSECRRALYPHVGFVEGITSGTLGNPRRQIVARLPYRGEQILGDATERAVRCNQSRQTAYHKSSARNKRDDEQSEHTVTQPRKRLGIAEAVALHSACDGRNAVLHHSQRADYRTVDSSEQQRKYHQYGDYTEIQSQQSRQELNLRQPAEPRMERPRKVEEQQRNEYEAYDGECNSDFSQHNFLFLSYAPQRPTTAAVRSGGRLLTQRFLSMAKIMIFRNPP